MSTLPAGTVTFLFTDIEGSTKLAQQYPDRWEALRQRHHAILHLAIESNNGNIFQIVGDAFCAAFHTASDALKAASDAQRQLYRETWDPAPIKVRMGIHTGSAQLSNDTLSIEYTGYTTLALTNRIMSAGHGGQILLSGATYELVRDALPENSELLDLGEKRLKDLLHPEHLSQLSLADLPKTFPPLKTLDAYPNNLPMQLTTFIGREQEIVEIKQKLETHRLVTLIGSGGTGKTRLSLQVAADLLEAFEQGVWFVELAPLADPELIPQTILAAIGIIEQTGRPPLERLKDYLHEKQVLIVLDNCEHLIQASMNVASALLNTVPRLKILASSREPLGVNGELSFAVPSLSLPDLKQLPAFEQLSQYEAVRLFIDRALLVSGHFTVDKDNAPFIAQICHRLDGIPLAIELAAARTRMISVEQISARLDDRFRLLTGGARTALPRQQTLRALIDWSYDLLTETEKLLLQRLSIFMGGWTLEAAEEVCSGETIESVEVLDLLAQLVNKSLVMVIERARAGETRYRMLETIRQYSREKLLETPGIQGIRQKHLAYFAKLAEQAGPELVRSQQAVWLNRLEDELDNLRMALEWALVNDVQAGMRIVSMPELFWEERCTSFEYEDWLNKLLQVYAVQDALRARALVLQSQSLAMQGNFDQARTIAEQSLQLAQTLNDKEPQALSLLVLGQIISFQGFHKEGIPLVEQSLVLFRELGELSGQAAATGWLSLNFQDPECSTAYAKEGLRLQREVGNLSGIANCLYLLAQSTCWGGDFSSPAGWLDEARNLYKQLGSRTGETSVLNGLGRLSYWQADYQQACVYFNECIRLGEQIDYQMLTLWARVGLAYAVLRQGNIQPARLMFEDCIRRTQKAGLTIAMVYAAEGVASLNAILGQAHRALRLFAWSTIMREKIGDQRPLVEQASVGRELAALHSNMDEMEFATLSAEGCAMTTEQAIALALED